MARSTREVKALNRWKRLKGKGPSKPGRNNAQEHPLNAAQEAIIPAPPAMRTKEVQYVMS